MDPQQKLLLEQGYSSLSMAGYSMATLQGSVTGVYAAVSDIGFGAGVVSERISTQHLHWHGGCMQRCIWPCVVRTRPARPMRVHRHSMLCWPCGHPRRGTLTEERRGRGVPRSRRESSASHQHQSVFFARLSMTSKRGRCHTFDQRADGYGRCEGSSAAALGPAEEDKPVHTMLSSVGVRQDGRSASLTAPNGVAQFNLIKSVLQRSGLTKAQLSFVEAHGTGTPLGDPQETGALSNVYKGNPYHDHKR